MTSNVNKHFPHGGDWASYEAVCGGEVLDFSANVSPLGMPARVGEAAFASLKNAHRYPDPECRNLRQAIAGKYDLNCEHILCGNGAADLIYRLVYAARPRRAVVLAPDFCEYEEALRQVGCEVEYCEWMRETGLGNIPEVAKLSEIPEVAELGEIAKDKERIEIEEVTELSGIPKDKDRIEIEEATELSGISKSKARIKIQENSKRSEIPDGTEVSVIQNNLTRSEITKNPGSGEFSAGSNLSEITADMIIFSNPNNPSGCLFPKNYLCRLVEHCEQMNTLLIVDECFIEFDDEAEENSLLKMVAAHKCLCVLRAFTKFYGMAGLRLGWCATSNEELLTGMKEAGPPWAVSIPAQAAGIAALREDEYADTLRRLIAEERSKMQVGLRNLGFQVVPGKANYILFYTEKTDLAGHLLKKGIAIRDCSNYHGLGPGWFRVAVRLREENEVLMGALRRVHLSDS